MRIRDPSAIAASRMQMLTLSNTRKNLLFDIQPNPAKRGSPRLVVLEKGRGKGDIQDPIGHSLLCRKHFFLSTYITFYHKAVIGTDRDSGHGNKNIF